ncbi:undecaprenyl phosphate N,N'-diacetylbacillosamine 1-phosphate transferase [Fulvivirga kasyanovii]|uniref:Sugar transferase n=1 Tax=Fulvivirga kasyanovii TaxID=396812 RepID=A0ABW9RKN1_9BACT|nr:sugar transferase [Fulvivirga kasyanovii]MTI24653.1 sugar transferase [Fulvivirga kasyanovii]
MYRKYFKALFDFCFALAAFVILMPVFLLVALLLSLFQRGQVFFTQYRPGKGEKIFKLIKFKTMRDDYDKNGHLLPDENRLTTIGALVRKTSLDEIPQLINIIKGDMSFVGPRPLLIEYLPLYSKEQRKRHEVKPGLSGWAQVNGRNAISWQKKFEYDVWYVENISFFLDIKILFLTILRVVKAKGISGEGMVTMEKFKGNE